MPDRPGDHDADWRSVVFHSIDGQARETEQAGQPLLGEPKFQSDVEEFFFGKAVKLILHDALCIPNMRIMGIHST